MVAMACSRHSSSSRRHGSQCSRLQAASRVWPKAAAGRPSMLSHPSHSLSGACHRCSSIFLVVLSRDHPVPPLPRRHQSASVIGSRRLRHLHHPRRQQRHQRQLLMAHRGGSLRAGRRQTGCGRSRHCVRRASSRCCDRHRPNPAASRLVAVCLVACRQWQHRQPEPLDVDLAVGR